MFMLAGCGEQTVIEDKVAEAYISANIDSEYERVFKDMGLGNIFDYDLKLTRADETLVSIWLEGYKHGQKIQEHPLIELTYGASLEQASEGQIGLGIIKGAEGTSMFIYSPHVRALPQVIDFDLFTSGVSQWSYTIGSEEVALNLGETTLLAVYIEQEMQDSIAMMRPYDFQNDEAERAIKENTAVLLLKIKVEGIDVSRDEGFNQSIKPFTNVDEVAEDIAADEYAEQLIGEWHGSAFVAAGYAQRYHFYNNGKFIYRASEMDGETRIRSIRGIWSVDHDTLSLNINEIDEIIGGEEVPASGSVGTEFEIVDGELVTKSVDYEETYRLGPIEEDSEVLRPKIVIDGVSFWRHSQNPDFY